MPDNASAQAGNEPRSGGGKSTFTRKMGPLPLWAWMGIGLAIGLVYYFYKQNKAASSSATTAGNAQGAGGVDASLVPQFVNQTYVNSTPPAVTTPTAPTTPPKTVSGASGSYTTGLANGMNEWTSTGKYSLNTIAKSHGMTPAQLIAASEGAENNTQLKAYVAKGNYNAMVPSGVELFIPNANWATK